MIKQNGVNKTRLIKKIIALICLTLPIFFVKYALRLDPAVYALLVFLAWGLIKCGCQKSNFNSFRLLQLSFLFVISFSLAYFIILAGWPIFYLPFSVTPMLCTILFSNLQLSFFITIATAFGIASLVGDSFSTAILFIISGILSAILVYDVRRRIPVIRTGFLVGLAQAVTLFFIEHFQFRQFSNYLILMVNGVASSIIVLGVLPIFEYLFKTITNISLLELADFNHPLLHRMMLEAPGTYHHSLIVGNLSEAASSATGAHALLARIGAYYHDIGKLEKPQYFSENQQMNENIHAVLSPAMSKLVIMNHVREGIELAKRYALNPALIDFIQQHHGSSLVYYFYHRALENVEEEKVKEEGFRYPGPKPKSKETAIVLLADSAEAATRTLKNPSPAGIERLVHKIINNKFIDGQLDACDLTLKDLEKISAVFSRILSGIYHSRITYPDEKSKSNYKKSPEKTFPPPAKDKETRT